MYLPKVLAGDELIKWSFKVLLVINQFIYVEVEIEAHEKVNEHGT